MEEFLHFHFPLANKLLHDLRVQRLRRFHSGPLVQPSDELVSAKVDLVRGCVGDGQLADLVVREFDYGRASLEMPYSG